MCVGQSHTHPPLVAVHTSTVVCAYSHLHTHQPSVALMHDHIQQPIQHRSNIPCQEIKFGDASDVIPAIKSKITYDEFEYDCTSLRRIAPLRVLQQVRPSVHSHHGSNR